MSHIATHGSKIGIVNPQLFRQAMNLAAEDFNCPLEEGGEVFEYLKHDKRKCDFAIRPKFLERGFGVTMNKDGTVSFVGDPYGAYQQWNSIQQQLEQHYQVLSIRAQAASYGWPVEAFSAAPGKPVDMELVVE